METWSTPPPLIISVARSVKRVSLPSSASLFRAHGGISALFRCRFSAADPRSGTMLFPADFFWDLRVRARMGNFADFPDLTCGSLFPGCHLTFSAAIFTRIFPFGPFRAGTCQHTRDARGRARMDRGDTGTDAGPADRTTRSTPARNRRPQHVTRGKWYNPRTWAACTEGAHTRRTSGTADRRQRAPHRENVTRGRSRHRTTTGSAARIDPWQVYPGRTAEAAAKPGSPLLLFARLTYRSSTRRRKRPHTRPANFGNVARIPRGKC